MRWPLWERPMRCLTQRLPFLPAALGPSVSSMKWTRWPPRVPPALATSKLVAVITAPTAECQVGSRLPRPRVINALAGVERWRGHTCWTRMVLTLWWGPGPATSGCPDPSTQGPAGTARPAGPLRSCWSRCPPNRGSFPSSRRPCLPGSRGQTRSRAPRSSRSWRLGWWSGSRWGGKGHG